MLKSLLALVSGGVFSKLVVVALVAFLVRLGLGVALYVGFDQVLSYIMTDIKGLFDGLPDLALNFLGIVHADILINTVLSAYSTAVIVVSLKKFRIM
ncbi:DUF2523 family protein [Shewanella sp.]|uniref:DUF2523 family protein n=1 Tax=Shewanella sp. TaxID=50422 RepID=UPI001D73C3ED|nr:DUF2523 family protein [Shewanella sp.]MCJ8305152.1 DUF2523 domain-containing protein [Shewanella sp.]NQY27814.1 DUF2523 domain-containing protein [Piscirickettsiaceae bacterium]NQZ33972.1 DUF2523 domain-containing protein [Oceanospirillaceae bacterium]